MNGDGDGVFADLVWNMLTPEMRISCLIFFEAGDDGLTEAEATRRFREHCNITNSEIEEWRQRAVYGSRPDMQ